MSSVSSGNTQEERVAMLEDGTVGVFVREDGGGWYLWRSSSLDGTPWLAEPAQIGTHHPTNNAWRRIPEVS